MSRVYGTVSMGLRAPIIRQGDNLVDIVTGCVVEAMNVEGLMPRDRDVVCMTEAIVARAQGNYASVDQIAADVKNKFGGDTVGVIFPILSRNRFAICLRGIAKGCKKVVLMLSYPSDEVGNHLVDLDALDEKGIHYMPVKGAVMKHIYPAHELRAMGDADILIHAEHIRRIKQKMNEELAKNTGKDLADVEKDVERDYFMTAEQAKAYGIIDDIIPPRR